MTCPVFAFDMSEYRDVIADCSRVRLYQSHTIIHHALRGAEALRGGSEADFEAITADRVHDRSTSGPSAERLQVMRRNTLHAQLRLP
jgi:hypothetical protein